MATPLGDLLLIADPAHLLGVYFVGQKYAPDGRQLNHGADHPVLRHATLEINEYFEGKRTGFSVPYRFLGTPFQAAVWREIARIRPGETISYSELAARAGAPSAIRATGAATGRNPLCLIVPCHRVVGKDGGLHGFAGGLERKRHLLASERVA